MILLIHDDSPFLSAGSSAGRLLPAACPRTSATQLQRLLYQRCSSMLWWPLLWHLELPQAAVCSIFWCFAKIKPGTPVLQFHTPAVSLLHGSCMSSYHCSKMKEGNDALHRQSHQLFLSDLSRFEKVVYFSPYYQSFKQIYKTPQKWL